MPLFKVTAKITNYSTLVVEAPTEAGALEIAEQTDGGQFKPDTRLHSGSWTIDRAVKLLEQDDVPLTINDVHLVPFDEDQPLTCPECGARTDLSEVISGPARAELQECLNPDCGFLFVVEYETEQEYKDRCCDPA